MIAFAVVALPALGLDKATTPSAQDRPRTDVVIERIDISD